MTRRRKVPNVMRTKSKLNMTNIRSDKMSDVKKFYGWSEHKLEQEVRSVVGTQASRQSIEQVYNEAYKKKD